jgi:hypothetical protein
MAKTVWFPVFIGLVASGAAPAAALAATQFQPEAQALWVKRTEAMARVAGDGTVKLDGPTILGNMRSSCEGMQAEQISHEYGKTPRWALMVQIHACSAYYRWTGGAWGATKVPCLDVQRAIEDLSQMKSEDEGAEVVTAASNLKESLTALLQSAKGGNFRCRY